MQEVNYKTLTNISIAASKCRRCGLYKNGHASPFIGNNIKAILFSEAPGADEITKNSPFVGKAGQILWNCLAKHNLSRDDFLVINACNCRPIIKKGNNIKNGKPQLDEMEKCRALNTLYLNNCDVTYIMTLGNYPKWFFTNHIGNITGDAGKIVEWNNKKVLFNFHPASLIYNPDNKKLFELFIDKFAGLINE